MRFLTMMMTSAFWPCIAMGAESGDIEALKKMIALQQADIAQLKSQPRVCRGVTAASDIKWEPYSGDAKYAHGTIDTKSCAFRNVPAYFVSGRTLSNSATWELGGYTGIYFPTKTGFEVYVWNGYSQANRPIDIVKNNNYYLDWVGIE